MNDFKGRRAPPQRGGTGSREHGPAAKQGRADPEPDSWSLLVLAAERIVAGATGLAARAKGGTKGGAKETELNELTVKPTKPPAGLMAVTTVTPVANWPKAWRNWLWEKSGVSARVGGVAAPGEGFKSMA